MCQVVVGSFGSVNVTEFMASVNTTAITELLDVGALAGKAAGAGVSLLDFALKAGATHMALNSLYDNDWMLIGGSIESMVDWRLH